MMRERPFALLCVVYLANAIVNQRESPEVEQTDSPKHAKALKLDSKAFEGSFGEDQKVWEDSNRDWPVISWEEARDKAVTLSHYMKEEEINRLLRGTEFNLAAGKPNDGYYIGTTEPLPRFNIPSLKMQDAGNGFRPTEERQFGHTTAFPSLLALASTWDPDLVEETARAMGTEFRKKGSNVMLGPSVQVHRTAFGGRNFEYLSGEDPYLGAQLTSSFVKGVQSRGVMAVLKHFAFNEQETQRMASDSHIDERTAWSLYYPPFEAGIAAGAGGVMCSYNLVNGTHACENEDLLRRDLRGKMGFKGIVMSDWFAGHGDAKALERGLDMEMPGPDAKGNFGVFTNANLGKLSNETRREAATRVLTSILHQNMHEQKSCVPPCLGRLNAEISKDRGSFAASEAATESVTLLQNDGTLPIDAQKVKRILVLGHVADADMGSGYYAGGGSGNVPAERLIKPIDGITQRAQASNITVDSDFSGEVDPALEKAHLADVIIVVAGAKTGEGEDRKTLKLDGRVDRLISAVAPIKPTVVLMQTPGAVLTPWRQSVSAALNLFYAGEKTGQAWAAVLFGDRSPSGKLPIMFPAEKRDAIAPSEKIFTNYTEGLFTSYRSDKLRAAYPFGHGLSYASFEYSEPEVTYEECESELCLSMNVTNVGRFPGAEVAQVYIAFKEKWDQPAKTLKGFHKTEYLQPGETDVATFRFSERDLSVYQTGKGWVLPIWFELHFGSSSADIRFVERLNTKGFRETKPTKPTIFSQKDGFVIPEHHVPVQHPVQMKATQREDWSPYLSAITRMNKAEVERSESKLDELANIGESLFKASGLDVHATRSTNRGVDQAVTMGAKIVKASQRGMPPPVTQIHGLPQSASEWGNQQLASQLPPQPASQLPTQPASQLPPQPASQLPPQPASQFQRDEENALLKKELEEKEALLAQEKAKNEQAREMEARQQFQAARSATEIAQHPPITPTPTHHHAPKQNHMPVGILPVATGAHEDQMKAIMNVLGEQAAKMAGSKEEQNKLMAQMFMHD